MTFQLKFCKETHWTFTAKIRLHAFMTTKDMDLEVTAVVEFLLTDVTRIPVTFIVQLQQMSLELVAMCETVLAVSAREWLGTSVGVHMTLQNGTTFKHSSTVLAAVWPLCIVYTKFVLLQCAGFG